MQENLRPFAMDQPAAQPKFSANQFANQARENSNQQKLLFRGLVIVAILVLLTFGYKIISRWNLEKKNHTITEEIIQNDEREIDNDDNFDGLDIKLDLTKKPDNSTLNEYLNTRLMEILPSIDLDDHFSVYLSPESSQKMMKLYHEESLNIFKTKLSELKKYRTILQSKYSKGIGFFIY